MAEKNSPKDGGPAFPGTKENYEFSGEAGMSLRDYFAAKALDGFMHWVLDRPHFVDCDSAAKAACGYAKSAYLIADAMLEAREK